MESPEPKVGINQVKHPFSEFVSHGYLKTGRTENP